MIIYAKCLCTSEHKIKAKKLNAEVRLVSNPVWRKEAAEYMKSGIKLPFKVEDGICTPL